MRKKRALTGLLHGLNRDSNLSAACNSAVIGLELFQYSLQHYVTGKNVSRQRFCRSNATDVNSGKT